MVQAASGQTLCSYLFFLLFVMVLQLKNMKIFYNLELRGRCDLEVKPTFMVRDVPWLVINNTKILNEMFKGDNRSNLETAHTSHLYVCMHVIWKSAPMKQWQWSKFSMIIL